MSEKQDKQESRAMTSIGSDVGWATFKTNHLVLYFIILTLCCVGLFVSNCVQGVFFKKMADDMPSGPYFILVTCSASFVVVFGVCLVVRDVYEKYLEVHINAFIGKVYKKFLMRRKALRNGKHQENSSLLKGDSVSSGLDQSNSSLNALENEQESNDVEEIEKKPVKRGRLSHRSLFVIGALDSMNGLLVLFAAHATPAALQPILSQSAVPMTFVMAYILIHLPIMLKKRPFSENKSYWKHTLKFFSLELLAALIVLAGVIVTLIPVFIKIANDPKSMDGSVFWSLIFLVGIIPGSLMSVVQELYSKQHQKLDYLHLLLWVSIYQIVVDASSFWFNMVVPGVGIHNLSDLGNMFDRGFGCLFNQNQTSPIGNYTNLNQTFQFSNYSSSNTTQPTSLDGCGMASLDTFVFIMGYVGTYAFTAILLKMTSSITLILINSFVAPATDILFFILGMDEFSWYTGGAIVIITVGVLIQIGSDYFKEKSAKLLESKEESEKEMIL
ncbi:predicted protein [Naegleria gruberi]|uniref:Predicted protein n=1 Tax=Naegleria gruberi TaxID=5762 RepID=D2V8F5_NAEGR|nr:uncharacterized protein NAEGRDRAFT_65138 [Naegleria gruberi]EFC46799.1 predicted protein [Naegleria gruberi]|eukprot:XP_002679543.1 predicted protein [Naegleria gruberi strain NEG-M]